MTKIPEGWIETTLSEIADIIMGQSPKGESYNLDGDGLPFYQGITEFTDKYVGLKTYTNQPTKVIGPGTILFSVRAPVGKVNFTKWEACIGRGNAGINMKNGNQEYLFYLLKYIESQILKSASGTVFDSISGKELQKISVIVPQNPGEQKAIAGVLSSFDDKIELLKAENQTLEGMGQSLFKEWFGKYKVGDELPDGWKVGKIEDLTEQMASGGTPSTKESSYYNGEINWFSTKEFQDNFLFKSEKQITESGLQNSSAKLYPENTVLMAIYAAPTVGRLGILTEASAFNQAAVGLIAKKGIGMPYIYLLLQYYRNEFNNLANGAAQQNLSVGLVKNFQVIIPNQEYLSKFNLVAEPIFNKIRLNSEEINNLSKTRDQLLPKLMSGEVRVEF